MSLEIRQLNQNIIWNLYRNTKSYTGAYPNGFIKKLDKLIGLSGKDVFHVFGGITQAGLNNNHTNDINPKLPTTYHFDARGKFPIEDNKYDVVLCDPPYDLEVANIHLSDKKRRLHYGKGLYNTEFVSPYSFIDEAVRICKPDGYICILHFLVYKRPANTERVIIIPVISGPNLRIRALNIFKKL
ncbi:MAG: hypothetical protein AABY22_32720 [Nanoarchaeota archaeon]